jgi:hypothetical protein
LFTGEVVNNHDELMSNFFAQPDALAYGKVGLSIYISTKRIRKRIQETIFACYKGQGILLLYLIHSAGVVCSDV